MTSETLNPGSAPSGTSPGEAVQAPHAPEPHRARVALEILGAAAVLGLAGNWLLHEIPWGLGLPAWIVMLVTAAAAVAGRSRTRLDRAGWMWLGVALLFASLVAWRDSPVPLLLNVLAALIALATAAAAFGGGRLRRVGVVEYAGWLLLAGLQAVAGALLLVLRDLRWADVRNRSSGGQVMAVTRGVLLAAPLLLVFGLLFASADPVFERLTQRLFQWRRDLVLETAFWTVFWGVLAAGYLRHLLLARSTRLRLPILQPASGARPPETPPLAIGGVEVVVILSLLNVLFLAFVLVQLRYLFGGTEIVHTTLGLSYAEYARRGFFELVAAAALLMPVLLALHALLGEEPRYRVRFRALSGLLIVLLFVVLVSAAERMRLYTLAYGLTELRFYTSAFMVWIALTALWMGSTVLRGRREWFMGGAVAAGLTTILLLNVVNPDARIAESVLDRSTDQADLPYLAELSADAVPVLARDLSRLDSVEGCRVVLRMAHSSWGPYSASEPDWRSWNLSRARAARVVPESWLRMRADECQRPTRSGGVGDSGSESEGLSSRTQ
jgi:hypothetical protein